MSENEPTVAPQVPEDVIKDVKRGFSLKDRLEKRGLRKVSVTLFLDQNVGADHREVVEKIAALTKAVDVGDREEADAAKEIKALDATRVELEEALKQDSIVVVLRAVPPVIAKDCRRRARATVGVEEKNVPEDRMEDFVQAYNAHLLSLTAQSVTESTTGSVNEGLSYEDAVTLMELLPSDQFERLSSALSEVQFRDAFSKSIEAQEDFS